MSHWELKIILTLVNRSTFYHKLNSACAVTLNGPLSYLTQVYSGLAVRQAPTFVQCVYILVSSWVVVDRCRNFVESDLVFSQKRSVDQYNSHLQFTINFWIYTDLELNILEKFCYILVACRFLRARKQYFKPELQGGLWWSVKSVSFIKDEKSDTAMMKIWNR